LPPVRCQWRVWLAMTNIIMNIKLNI
jgi:hypothetical protein